jgi:hypothetical protein
MWVSRPRIFLHVILFVPQEVTLRNGSQSFGWWAKPPVVPMIKVYVYNVTNADEFLNNGSKPVVDELGPYVYVWVKVAHSPTGKEFARTSYVRRECGESGGAATGRATQRRLPLPAPSTPKWRSLIRFFRREKWEKKNIRFHDNGTVSFNQEKIYTFDESLSAGFEDDVVVVPNIPMLVGDG